MTLGRELRALYVNNKPGLVVDNRNNSRSWDQAFRFYVKLKVMVNIKDSLLRA